MQLQEYADVNLIYSDDGKTVEGFICPGCEEAVIFEDYNNSEDTEDWELCPYCSCEWEDWHC